MPANVPNQTLLAYLHGDGLYRTFPEAAPLVGLANPTLSTNIGGIADWNTSFTFIDLMKQSRPWAANYGDWDALNAGGFIEPDGWPNAIPAGSPSVGTIFDWGDADASYLNGERVVVTWDGTGTVAVGGSVSVISSGANTLTFDFNSSVSTLSVSITSTAAPPNNVKNIRIIPQKFQSNYDAGERINPDYKRLCSDFRELRVMTWTQTNNSWVSEWADRTLESAVTFSNFGNSTQENHAPIEYLPELINAANCDLWFCLPHQCTDDYVTQVGTYLRDNIRSDRKITFELSNEVWNATYIGGPFVQGDYFVAQGRAAWPGASGDSDTEVNYSAYAKRATECFQILQGIFSGAPQRLVCALGSWNDDTNFMTTQVTAAPLWSTYDPGTYVRPSTVADAVAIAPYYGTEMNPGENANVAAAYATNTHLQYIYNWLLDPANDSSLPYMQNAIGLQKAVADAEGLDLIQYEGLRHYLHGGFATGDALAAYLEFANSIYDADIATRVWEHWETVGNGPLQVFGLIGGYGNFGVWSFIEAYGTTSPYAEALSGLNTYTPNWWGGTGDYRHVLPNNSTDYMPGPGTAKPTSGALRGEIDRVSGHVAGHSLWQHGGTDYHTGEWLGRFTTHAGKTSTFAGRFGQLDMHAAAIPWAAVDNNFGYPSSQPVDLWTGGLWGDTDWSHVFTMPWNFAQASTAFNTRPDPLTHLESVVDYWVSNAPNAKRHIFEHWPETGTMSGVPASPSLSDADWRTYWTYTRSTYHTWFLGFQNEINTTRPTANVYMIPVGPVLADLFLDEAYMSGVPSTDYFEDAAPHGLPALYFLSALIWYRVIFGVNVPSDYVIPVTSPADIPSEIRNNFAAILTFIETRLDHYNANGVRVY